MARRTIPGRELIALAFACCAGLSAPAAPSGAAIVPTGFVDEVVTGGLFAPTSFAFLPDGRALVTEQFTGAIRLVAQGVLAPGALATVPGLATAPERGLLSIAVDPRWPASPYVYVHFTRIGGTIRLARLTASGDLSDPASTALALGDLYVVLDGLADAADNHNGGALRFGPDGRLYFSLGDDANACAAQDSTSLRGCLLRLDVSALPAGPGGPPPRADLVPADNPFAASANEGARLVYAYGLRNPFRFHIDPATGLVYLGDVGEGSWEELDELRSGDNAGWPYREGFAPIAFPGCPEPGGPGTGAYVEPIAAYGHDEGVVVISAGVLRRGPGSAWPEAWEGNVFYADYATGFLRMLESGAGGWQPAIAPGQPNATDWATGLAFAVDFQWGPDGHLWWLAQYGVGGGGGLRRIRTSGGVSGVTPAPSGRLSLAVAPNPSRGGVSFGLTLPQGGAMRLAVLDVAGRQVALVDAGRREAGPRAAAWDGRLAGGALAPAGLYFARLELDGQAVTAKIVRAD